MKSNGKLILKVKKKRPSISTEKFQKDHLIKEDKENVEKLHGKRVNPFSSNVTNEPRKVRKKDDDEEEKNSFFRRRSSCQSRSFSISSLEIPANISSEDDVIISPQREQHLKHMKKEIIKFRGDIFPLNWSLFEKAKFISARHFSVLKNIKPANECKGIRNFIENRESNRHFHENIFNWIFPNVPGLATYPQRKKITGNLIKDDSEINLLSNNRRFQDAILREWRTSFQSLFAMLKTNSCPYFYFCSYQFTVIFKASCLANGCSEAIISPTTKGFRKMLQDEGVQFDFPYCDATSHNKSDEVFDSSDTTDVKELDTSLNDSGNNEAFLDSIGLDKKTHFPDMIEQQRLADKSKAKKFDLGVESTIRVRECQSLFNFLLNSKFLCAPSGNMYGIPPTLLSPSPFQGASLNKCKMSYTDVKVLRDNTYHNKHCLEISGPILPTQIIGILESLDIRGHDFVHIQGKIYSCTSPLNTPADRVQLTGDQCEKTGLPQIAVSYFNQIPITLPSNFEIDYTNGEFLLK